MKNPTLIILLTLHCSLFTLHCSLFTLHAFSQPCLPEGITFTTQEEIDSFQTNYPNCTEIEGDVRIGALFMGSNITNLNGLSVLTSIGGSLAIGDGFIRYNPFLTSLTGLDNVISIGGGLIIWSNASLTSLIGLNSLTSIGGGLLINGNNNLTTLNGLDNINAASIEGLHIKENNSLSTCELQNICDYLLSPNGTVDIYDNAIGCNSTTQVANTCGITLPCLPFGNYYLSTQADIDNFQTNYPNCTEIEGDLHIGSFSGTDITNLNGLITLTYIAGDLRIYGNDSLTSLSGLDNVTFIGGELWIGDNDVLSSLTGLENLTYTGGLVIGWMGMWGYGNPSLTSLMGLNNLTSIGGKLQIAQNNTLPSLSGLDNLTFIGGDLIIGNSIGMNGNYALTNLTGLDNVTSIGGDLTIAHNLALTSLMALDNIDAASIDELQIKENSSLSTCEAQSICEYLASPGGDIEIHDNAPGCNNTIQVITACEDYLCLADGITFTSQAQIDNFQINNPSCTEIVGDVIIEGNDISNLNGLNNIISFWEDVDIRNNNSLTDLSGLNGIVSIGGNLAVYNNAALTNFGGLSNFSSVGENFFIHDNSSLTNLTGLEQLLYIGENLEIKNNTSLNSFSGLANLESTTKDLVIENNDLLLNLSGLGNLNSVGKDLIVALNANLNSFEGLDQINTVGNNLMIQENDALTTLSGLESLSAIGGLLYIKNNNNLKSLSGIDNIGSGTIWHLGITYNDSLSVCHVQSICDYLAAPNGSVQINDNAPGCDSQAEVEDACETTGILDIDPESNFIISPNPLESGTTIEYTLYQNSPVTFKIFDLSGREIVTLVNKVQMQGKQILEFNGAGLKPGIYFVMLQAKQGTSTRKIIKL